MDTPIATGSGAGGGPTPARRRLGRMSIGSARSNSQGQRMPRLSLGARSIGGASVGGVSIGGVSVGADIEINDDEAERRKRRRNRKSFGAPLARPQGAAGGATNAQISQMYTTAIKLSTQNKINTKNSWTLSLIDHMGDLCRDYTSTNENSRPDFQKASCTLETSVKIYSYRVDDVWSSSFRVLENLSRTGRQQSEAQAAASKGTSKKLHVANTLESNPASISVAKFDMEFDIDPLFHKMAKAFDEGGARGMLLNNLGVHNGCSIMFDSVDARDVDVQIDEQAPAAAEAAQTSESSTTDAANLRGKLLQLCGSRGMAAVAAMPLCPFMDDMYAQLRQAQAAAAGESTGAADDSTGSGAMADASGSSGDGDSFKRGFEGGVFGDSDDDDQDGGNDFVDDYGEVDDRPLMDDGGSGPAASAVGPLELAPGIEEVRAGAVVTGNEAPAGIAAVLCDAAAMSKSNTEYAYFDESRLARLHHWAGPRQAHWKFGQQGSKTRSSSSSTAGGAKPATKRRAKKKAFRIDFFAEEVDAATEFAPPPRSATATQLSQAAIDKALACSESMVLPLDVHYELRELSTLFCKPGKLVSRRRSAAAGGEGAGVAGDGDGNVGAVAGSSDTLAADGDEYDDAFAFGGGGDDLGRDDDDDGDIFGADTGGDAMHGGTFLQDDFTLDGMVAQADIVKPVNVNYARVAKKVDVKQLKGDLWGCVASKAPPTTAVAPAAAAACEADENEPAMEAGKETLGKGGAGGSTAPLSFTKTVQALAPSNPESITVPFYFICMLHLANEKDLTLTGSEDLSDFGISLNQPSTAAV